MSHPSIEQPFVKGRMKSITGVVPCVGSDLKWSDKWGNIKARWGINRMNHRVDPGLYCLGRPDENAPVMVSANYKMSFDRLRESLPGRNAWILVLDTDGVNVWCAAGKGTFGTEELVKRIETSGLKKIVKKMELIVPQLGAPGISAHIVKKLTGFKVIYGPVLARDLPAFLDSGNKATKEMRRKRFTTWERTVLVPFEVVTAIKYGLVVSLLFLLVSGFGGPGSYIENMIDYGLIAVLAIISGIFAGAVVTPVLLPWLPGRAFSLKGVLPALVIASVLVLARTENLGTFAGNMESFSWFFIIPAISAFLAMNFTGCSTYTSLSGVRREMKTAVPMEIAAGFIGICLWIGSRIVA